MAEAGSSQTVPDDDGDGFATVSLDGSNSTGVIAGYAWSADAAAAAVPDGMFSEVTLPLGTHAVTLTVTDGLGGASVDKGGGGGGGRKGGGKSSRAGQAS